jgi:hypothetical protein
MVYPIDDSVIDIGPADTEAGLIHERDIIRAMTAKSVQETPSETPGWRQGILSIWMKTV